MLLKQQVMNIQWKKILLGFITFFTITFVCINVKNFFVYRTRFQNIFDDAELYARSDLCTNSAMRAKLGGYSRCDESDEILLTSPDWSATAQVIEDIYVFGNGRGERLVRGIENNMWYIIGTVFGCCMFAYKVWNDRQMQANIQHFGIPTFMQGARHPQIYAISNRAHAD